MRQYGRERLETAGEADGVRRRHAEYFVSLAETARSAAFGPDEDEWVRRVVGEFPNFRSAFDWSFAIGDADLALRLSVALGGFAVPRPHYSVARWLARALDIPAAHRHPLRPEAATWLAHSEMLLSKDTASLIEYGRLMDDAFAEADVELSVEAHGYHAILANRQEDLTTGRALHGRRRARHRDRRSASSLLPRRSRPLPRATRRARHRPAARRAGRCPASQLGSPSCSSRRLRTRSGTS